MKTIFLMRHGETQAPAGTFCGQTDVALSTVGKQQVRRGLQTLIENDVQVVITTGLRRSDYGGLQAAKQGLLHQVEPGFQEVNFGAWEGLRWGEIEAQFAKQAQHWLDSPDTMEFPAGDRMADFQKRLRQAWRHTLKRPESVIAIVGHGGVFAYVQRLITGNQQLSAMEYGEVRRFEVEA